jgi:predicted nucleic acid-binding protein
MAIYFFDTSALVKRYAPEEGTRWVQSVTDPASSNRIYIARITGAEVIAAFTRNVRDGDTTLANAAKVIVDFRYDFNNQYSLIEISELVVARAMALIETHTLKGYDGIQLAAAIAINAALLSINIPVVGGSALILVSADNQLNRAAAAEGLRLENPQSHLHPHDKVSP